MEALCWRDARQKDVAGGDAVFIHRRMQDLLSVILEPKGSLQESLLLTAEAAVAVYRAVKKITGVELDIKWVNDLYHNGKKVCGILTEAVTDLRVEILNLPWSESG